MCTEIEAKLKVDSLRQIADKLKQLDAEFCQEQLQTDYYLDDADGTLAKKDRCLRLRRLLVEKNEQFLLTYKGPKEKDNFKKRREIEINVQNIDSTAKLLAALGYEKALVFEKKRQLWKLGGCDVALDQLPLLGSFVEIEGPDDEKIAAVQTALGLKNLSHIQESYALLMEQKLHQTGDERKEILL